MRKRILTFIASGLLLLLQVNIAGADLNDGLVAWYPLNGSGLDASGHSYNGTVWGASPVTDRFGNAGSALGFDGINDYVGLPNNAPMWLPQNNFTVSAWVYFDADPRPNSHDFILDLDFTYWTDPAWCRGYCILRQSGTGKAQFQLETATTTDILLSSDTLAKNSWYHFVGVRNGATQEIYLDGELAASAICSSLPIDFSTPTDDDKVNIGRFTDSTWTTGTYYLDGKIDDVRIYNRALSAEEVELLYNVPEPGTVMLLGLGVIVLRKRKASRSTV